MNARRLRLLHGQLQVVARQQHNSDLRQLLLFSGIAFGGIALLTIALSWLTAGRVLRPLRTITSRTRELSASNLHERLQLSGPKDELHELGDTIDQLLERLDRSFQAQRQFVANASHELRTPLATMRASVDVALAKPAPIPEQTVLLATRLNAELDQVDRLLESFLTLARAERGSDVDEEPFRLDLLVARALERHESEIVRRSVRVIEDSSPDAWVEGDEILLTWMVENLVDNALRHNDWGGYLNISTKATSEASLLVVENGGEVLDEAAVAALGQPFRRIRAERTGSEVGSGLGLSIVTAIVESHGGRTELQARPEGGLRVTVELPLATPRLAGAAR